MKIESDRFGQFQGADDFTHKIDIEVQYASQSAISAIERVGGRIRVSYYDPDSLQVPAFSADFMRLSNFLWPSFQAAVDPRTWFRSGVPVPARKAPPPSLLE